MIPSLEALITLQALDSAIEQARKRLAELPLMEQAIAAEVAAAQASVATAKAKLQENATARRELDKGVAAIDTRLSRFDDHKAAVKTNQEYTALLHEIATAKGEKDALEEQILGLMETADGLTAEIKIAESGLATANAKAGAARAAIADERSQHDAALAGLTTDRARHAAGVDARPLALYEQLLKGRRGVAVARMANSGCTACHVRLRPHIEQQIRRNDSIVQCESCQRILYFVATPSPAGSDGPGSTAGTPSAPLAAPAT